MSLPNVILTVLSRQDMSGYDVTKAFEGTLGHTWKASHQQVYREMTRLFEKGLLDCVHIPQLGKPDRKEYSITEAGRKELDNWLSTEMGLETIRDAYSARILACAERPCDDFIEILTAALTVSTKQFHEFEKELRMYDDKAELTRHEVCERLTVRRNVLMFEAWNKWAAEVIEELCSL